MPNKVEKIEQLFQESIKVKTQVLDSGILTNLVSMGLVMAKAIQEGNKLMLCGMVDLPLMHSIWQQKC